MSAHRNYHHEEIAWHFETTRHRRDSSRTNAQVLWDAASNESVSTQSLKARTLLYRDTDGRLVLQILDGQGALVGHARTASQVVPAEGFHLITLSQARDAAPVLFIDDAQVKWDTVTANGYRYTMAREVSQVVSNVQRDLRLGAAFVNSPNLSALSGWVRGLVVRNEAQNLSKVRAQYEGAHQQSPRAQLNVR